MVLRYRGFRPSPSSPSPKPPIIGHPMGLEPGQTFRVPAEGLVIGRSHGTGLVIASEHVARKHLRLSWAPNGALVAEDLQSTNGTQINGAAVDPRAPRSLRSGDVLTIASVFAFEVVDAE